MENLAYNFNNTVVIFKGINDKRIVCEIISNIVKQVDFHITMIMIVYDQSNDFSFNI